MIGWLQARRQAKRERDTEVRLRRLIWNVSQAPREFYIPAEWVAILGPRRVDAVLAEFGLPPVQEDRRAA